NGFRGKQVLEEVRAASENENISYEHADLSSLSQVKELAAVINEKHGLLDVLINNAGVFMRAQTYSEDGIEMTFAVNHLAHFALSLQLLPSLIKAKQGRIISVSSIAHTNGPRIDFTDLQEINSYIDYSAYALSKLANVIFSNELAERLRGTHITSNSLHPGVISTKLLQSGFGISGSPVEEGCKTSVFLASDRSLAKTSGKYFSGSAETDSSPFSYDPGTRKNLWSMSEELCEIHLSDFI
ncbi:MAG: SDR family NAD(P)-dependent oxidoreductase, partial [Bacteroidetes bacterium]|nr:SDR family NAD(P)-dependent oxidoreductase [Bacteroidota bacterium]